VISSSSKQSSQEKSNLTTKINDPLMEEKNDTGLEE
jgi:hypothetical protein